jgi:hypothetical protein
MFDELAAFASVASGGAAVGAWVRVENAACARRLSAMADLLEQRWAEDGSAADVSTVGWSLIPQPDGTLRGVGTRTILTDQCGHGWQANGGCPGHRGHRRPDAASHALTEGPGSGRRLWGSSD